MNKKIFFSGASILAAIAMMGGATFAFFSDSDTSTANAFSSGSFEIVVNDNGVSPSFNWIIGNIAGLFPGDITDSSTIEVVNASSINAATFGRLTLTAPGSPDLSDELSIYNYKVDYFDDAACSVPTARWATTDPYFGLDNNEDWFIKDGVVHPDFVTAGGTGNLKSWVTGDGPLDVPGTAWDIEGLKPGECYILTLQFQMDEDADNSFQGASVTVGYEVESTQVNEVAIENLGLDGISDASSIIGYLQSQVTP